MTVLYLTVLSCFVIGLTSANHGSPPSVSRQVLRVQPGKTLYASCQSGKTDVTDIYWSKPDGRRVTLNPKSNVYSSLENRQSILVVQEANAANEGEYICHEESGKGETAVNEKFILQTSFEASPPLFEEPYVIINANIGSDVTLSCEALGDRPMEYIWLNQQHSSIITESTPGTVIYKRENSSELNLIRVSNETSGVYTCTARNHLGAESKLFRVIVNETAVPEPDDSVVFSVQNVTDTSVTFNLSSPGGTEINGFIAKYWLINDSEYVNLVRWLIGQRYTVSSLLSGGMYLFQFRSVSNLGPLSNWTDTLVVNLPPGPPEIIVNQVTSQIVQMEFFRPIYMFSSKTIDHYIIKYRIAHQEGGNKFIYSECEVSITLPSCRGNSYKITGLQTTTYYSITVQAVGPGGSSGISEFKIYIP